MSGKFYLMSRESYEGPHILRYRPRGCEMYVIYIDSPDHYNNIHILHTAYQWVQGKKLNNRRTNFSLVARTGGNRGAIIRIIATYEPREQYLKNRFNGLHKIESSGEVPFVLYHSGEEFDEEQKESLIESTTERLLAYDCKDRDFYFVAALSS